MKTQNNSSKQVYSNRRLYDSKLQLEFDNLEYELKRGKKECQKVINRLKKGSANGRIDNLMNGYTDEDDFIEDLPSMALLATGNSTGIKSMRLIKSDYYPMNCNCKTSEIHFHIPIPLKMVDDLFARYHVDLGTFCPLQDSLDGIYLLQLNWNHYMINQAKPFFPHGFFSGKIQF